MAAYSSGVAAGERPADLIDDYQPGSFFLALPDRTLLASDGEPVAAEHAAGRFVVGALPFGDAPAHLLAPERIRTAGVLYPHLPRPHPVARPTVRAIHPMPEPQDYQRHVADAVAELGGELRKVVLARTLLVTMAQPADLGAMLRALVLRNRRGHTYAVDLPGGRTLIGATPEMLVAKSGSTVVSNPYAGSAPRSADPVADRANADALLASAKDQAEHRVVVEAVVEALRPYCRSLDVPATPSLTSTSAVWHLATKVSGTLIDPSISALELAGVLHPTPAVCGMPTALAREAIARHEPFQRGFYGGAVGWSDEQGDGRWYVAIRCAEVSGPRVRLYAGAGIMPDSQPELELAETSAKFATLLQAIGLDLPV